MSGRVRLVSVGVSLLLVLACSCSDDGSGGSPDVGADGGAGDAQPHGDLADAGDDLADDGDVGGPDGPLEDAGGDGSDVDDDGGGFVPVTTTIGPEGGTVTSDDGLLTLEIPVGAVLETVEIAAVRLDDDDRFYESVSYALIPRGLQFEVPAQMRIDYPDDPPEDTVFGIGRDLDEVIQVWPTISSDGGSVEVWLDGFDDDLPEEKQRERQDLPASTREGLVLCDSTSERRLCPNVEMLGDGRTVRINEHGVPRQVEFASNNRLNVRLDEFTLLTRMVIDGERVHHLAGPARIYWYRFDDASNAYVARVAFFGDDGPAQISTFTARPRSATSVLLEWDEFGAETAGDFVVMRIGGGTADEIARVDYSTHSMLDTGLTAGVTYTYRIRHEPDGGRAGPWATATATPRGACTIIVHAYGDDVTPESSATATLLEKSSISLSTSDACLEPPIGTKTVEWYRIDRGIGEDGRPFENRQPIRTTPVFRHWLTTPYQVYADVLHDGVLVDTDSITLETFPADFLSIMAVVPGPPATLRESEQFIVEIRGPTNMPLLSTHSEVVTEVELAIWTLPVLPTDFEALTHHVVAENPDGNSFVIAPGDVPAGAYEARVRIFDEFGVVSIPSIAQFQVMPAL